MMYEIDKSGEKEPLKLSPSTLKSQDWDELKFQGYLFKDLVRFVGPDLYVISQSKKGQEQPDLAALDRFGDLWIFELKAITGSSENLLHALRYSQIYGSYTIDDLDAIYHTHRHTPDSLITDFCQYYGYTSPDAILEWTAKIGKKHHLVVVTNGADEDTLTAIAHWQNQGMDIRAWLYEIYTGNDGSFRLEVPELYYRGIRISTGENQVFLVNTDRRYNEASEPYMLEQHRALATSPGYMEQINRITNGSRVLLYAKKTGIIAGGIATAEKKNSTLAGKPIRYVQLVEFFELAKPLTQSEVKGFFGRGLPILQTLSAISNEIAEQVWKKALDRQKK